jgi:hypothetical protein
LAVSFWTLPFFVYFALAIPLAAAWKLFDIEIGGGPAAAIGILLLLASFLIAHWFRRHQAQESLRPGGDVSPP